MILDYNTLKRAAKEGWRLGNWNGKAVFAASVIQLQNLGDGVYYVLYDDENKLVAKTDGEWKSYGEVNEAGRVNEYSGARRYTIVVEAMNSNYTELNPYAPGYSASERPIGDVKMELDVEDTLKKARAMTVESLLEGFLSGG